MEYNRWNLLSDDGDDSKLMVNDSESKPKNKEQRERERLARFNQKQAERKRIEEGKQKALESKRKLEAESKRLESFQGLKVRSEAQAQLSWIENIKNNEKYQSKFKSYPQTAYIRLLNDLKQIDQEPLKTVSAAPLPSDFFTWHCNLRPNSGPYAGVTLHLQLRFPNTYPSAPPELTLFTPIPHPNVFGNWVCLNMLREEGGWYDAESIGWSSAYTVQSILVQLQTFLMAENVPQDYGSDKKGVVEVGSVDKTKEKIDAYKCKMCGHEYANPFPPLPPAELDTTGGGSVMGENTLSSIFECENRINMDDCSKQIKVVEDMCECEVEKGWYGARAETGFNFGGNLKHSIYFEMIVAGTGVSRLGWSLKRANYNLGTDSRGWGYGGTAKKSHNNIFTDYGEGYRKGDVISTSLDLVTGNIVYFKNGRCMGIAFTLPQELKGQKFYPTVAVRRMKFKLNFSKFIFTPNQFLKTGNVGPRTKIVRNQQEKGYLLNIVINKGTPILRVRPQLKTIQVEVQPENKNEILGPNLFEKLPDPVLAELLDFVDSKTLLHVQLMNRQFKRVIKNYFLLQKRELQCFHTKLSYKEAVLGVGIFVEKNNEIWSSGEILSWKAWSADKMRKGVWERNKSFQFWFPLIINSQNYIQVEKILKQEICQATNVKQYAPQLALNTIPRIMNSNISRFLTKVVNLQVVPSMCESVLQTYVSFQHMLLALKEPQLSNMVDNTLSQLKRGTNVDLLDLLQATVVSTKSFEDVKEDFVNEYLSKSVLKNCMSVWREDNKDSLEKKIADSFEAIKLPIQKFLVELFFLRNYGRFDTTENMLKQYNVSFGRVNELMAAKLRNGCNKLLVESDKDIIGTLYKYVGLEQPSNDKLSSILQKAVLQQSNQWKNKP